jgi:GNAT superfamily N-acetyltransferase
MGNTDDQIFASTLEGELATLRQFIELEKANKQITWMLRSDGKTIGAVWIELDATEHLQAPAVHIMIGDPEYRSKGIGKDVMRGVVEYIKNVLKSEYLYNRHLVSNDVIDKVTKSVGLTKYGHRYTDNNGLVWQNVRLEL